MESGYSKIINDDISYQNGDVSPKCVKIIDENTDDELEIQSFIQCRLRLCFYFLINILSCGLTLLCFRWKPIWKLNLTCKPCVLIRATHLLIKDIHGQKDVAEILEEDLEEVPSNIQRFPNDHEEENHWKPNSKTRYFVFHCLKYIWNHNDHCFYRLRGFDKDLLCSDFFDKMVGLTQQEVTLKSKLYGSNIIDIKVKSYLSLLIDEVLNPFYIFQIASMTLWSLDNYYYYASCILIISIISISISLYQTKKQMITLRNMVSQSNSLTVTVRRPGEESLQEVCAGDLVPGDLLVIPASGCLMCCDAVLTAGNCIVNESMLTGESVPETKTPLPNQEDHFNSVVHRRHTLFCGTQVIQTRYYGNSLVTAIVIRTGFSTSKGELIRSILFPKPMGFAFYRDSMRFVLFLFSLAAIGMVYSLYLYIERGASISDTIKKALDIITIVVPPALPAALTVGVVYAQGRLKAKGIYCISPPRINVSGKLKLMCFDKTGTLTEDGLDLFGIVPAKHKSFQSLMRDPQELPEKSALLAAMATCHSLTMINGELSGDPLDLKMFLATQWHLEEPGKDTTRFDMLMPTVVRPQLQNLQIRSSSSPMQAVYPQPTSDNDSLNNESMPQTSEISNEECCYEIGIMRQFPFSSSLQRMSVICRTLGARNMELYVKGAPEKVQSLCCPTTVPEDFTHVLEKYTLQGFRVLAFAYKQLSTKLHWHQVQRLKRDAVEFDLKFIGLMIMQNSLKMETTPVIQTLKQANIRMIMVTGDNLLTAISVARDCNLIPSSDKVKLVKAVESESGLGSEIVFEPAEKERDDEPYIGVYQTTHIEKRRQTHLVLDGRAFEVVRNHFPETFRKVLVKGTVFARMSPDQKTHLVEALQNIGYVTGMCGDGANDCGALKAAEIGISLSEAEASVAAPFTSRISNIQCVPIIIKEGRNALVTAFSIFKFIALYSIIQFISVLILYNSGANFADPMFLYIDLAIITPLAIAMGYTKTYPKLVSQRPLSNLMNISNLASMLLQACLVIFFQAVAIVFLGMQSWFRPNKVGLEINLLCWESTTIFLSSNYQYLVVAAVFARGPPFRQAFYTNGYLVLTLVVLFAFNTLLMFSPWEKLEIFFELMNWHPNRHFNFRLTLFFFCLIHLVLALAAEFFVARSVWLKRLSRFLRRKRFPKNPYKTIEMEMTGDEMLMS